MSAVAAAVNRLAREEGERVLALLSRRFGLDLADDAVQEALVEALSWSEVPQNPAAWLYTVARNRCVDRLRRNAAERRRLLAAAPDLLLGATPAPEELDADEEPEMIVDEAGVDDERLRLLLLCCHPALDRDAQVALTLRLIGGLSTAEIAAAFLVPEATLAQRIVRAKHKIRDARIPLTIPARLGERVNALLTVLYLIFNEGYLSRGAADGARVELVDDAIRLTAQAARLMPDHAEIEGLLALELFTRARMAARFEADQLVQLDQQDRGRWDQDLIAEADAILRRAIERQAPGPFQLQAVIARHHATAPTAADTDWAAIAAVYHQLHAMTGSAVVALNRAVAVAMAEGPQAGLALLDDIDGLDGYHLYWATRGELLHRLGDRPAAHAAFAQARTLTTNPAERRHLDQRVLATQP